MYQEMIDNYPDHKFIPGGATLNSIRYCQWLLGEKQQKACSFVGCVGKDAYAKTLHDLCVADGVNVQFYEVDTHPTGTCAVCITGHDRSLVANLAAADLYNKDAHLKSDSIWSLVSKAKLFYSAGFPLTDYLFGNETEAAKFSEANGGPKGTDTREIAKWASTLPKTNEKRERFVVFTQGLDPVIVASKGEIVLEVEVSKLPTDQIVDTNSAGDSFVGGFLAALAQDCDLAKCVQLGNAAAAYCIQKPGSVFEKQDSSAVLAKAGL